MEHVTYPEIYILKGGYQAFHQSYPGMCTPNGYVLMDNPEFKTTCNQKLAKLHRSF